MAGAWPGSGHSGGLGLAQLNQRGARAVAIARDVAGFLPATAVIFRLGGVVTRAIVVFLMHAAADGQRAGGDAGMGGILNGRI